MRWDITARGQARIVNPKKKFFSITTNVKYTLRCLLRSTNNRLVATYMSYI